MIAETKIISIAGFRWYWNPGQIGKIWFVASANTTEMHNVTCDPIERLRWKKKVTSRVY